MNCDQEDGGDGEGKVASSQYARVRMRKALRERLEGEVDGLQGLSSQDNHHERDFQILGDAPQSHPRRELQMARARARRRERGRNELDMDLHQLYRGVSPEESNWQTVHQSRHRHTQRYTSNQQRDGRSWQMRQSGVRRQNSANQHGQSWPTEFEGCGNHNRRSNERPPQTSSPRRTSSNPTGRGSLRDIGKYASVSTIQSDETPPHEQPSHPSECSRIRAKFRLNEGHEAYTVSNAYTNVQAKQAEAEVTLDDLQALPEDANQFTDRISPRQPVPPSTPPGHSPRRSPQPGSRAGSYFRSQPAVAPLGSPSKLRSVTVQAAKECRDLGGQSPSQTSPVTDPARSQCHPLLAADTPLCQCPAAVKSLPTPVPQTAVQFPEMAAETLQLQLLLDAACPSAPFEHLQHLIDMFTGSENQPPCHSESNILLYPSQVGAPALQSILSCFPAGEHNSLHLQDIAAAFQVDESPTAEAPSALQELCSAYPSAECGHLRLLIEATTGEIPTSPTSCHPKGPTTTESIWQPYEGYVYTRLNQDREAAAASCAVASSPFPNALTILARPSGMSPSKNHVPLSPVAVHNVAMQQPLNGTKPSYNAFAPRPSAISPDGNRQSPNSGSVRGVTTTASPARAGRHVSASRDQAGRWSNSGSGIAEASGLLSGPSMCGPAVRRRDRERGGASYGTSTLSREDLDRVRANDGIRGLEKAKEKGRIVRQWIDGLVGS